MNKIKCNYNISLGLIGMIASLTELEKGEIWSILGDAAQVCFDRIKSKNLRKSWRWYTFPKTPIRLKFTVKKGFNEHYCEIKLDSNQTESFTSKQIDEFLIEKILLAD